MDKIAQQQVGSRAIRYAVCPTPKKRLWASSREITALKLHACVVLLAVLLLFVLSPTMLLTVVGAVVAPVLIYMGIAETRRAPLGLTPLSFFFFWNAVNLGVAAFYVGWLLRAGEHIEFFFASIPAEDLAAGYTFYLIGSLALHAGLQLTRPHSSIARNSQTCPNLEQQRRISITPLVGLWLVGIFYQVRHDWFGPLGTVAQSLQWAALASVVIVALVPKEFFGFSKILYASFLTMGTGGLLFANLYTGSKAYIMFSFLPLVWMVILRRDFRRWLVPLMMFVFVLYFVVVAPTVTKSRRNLMATGETPTSHLINSVHLLGRPDAAGLGENLGDQLDTFLTRQFDPLPLGYLAGEVRKDGLQWGQTMGYAAYAFIPRFLWPEKPNVSRGAWFTTYLGLSPREEEATTSTGITATGELYWNFGLPGVIVGMLAIGMGYGLLWSMAGNNPIQRPLHMILYCLVTVAGMTDLPEAVTVSTRIVSQMLIFGVLFWAMKGARNAQLNTEVARR